MESSAGDRLISFAARLSARALEDRAAACPHARAAAEELARWAGLIRSAVGLQLELRDLLAMADRRHSELTSGAAASEAAPGRAVVEEIIAFLHAIVHPH